MTIAEKKAERVRTLAGRAFTLERRRHGWSSVVKKEKLFLLSFDPLFLSLLPRIQIQTVASARRSAATRVKPIRGEISRWESGDVKDGSNGIYRLDMLVRK